jgi:hypothetical protein
MLSRIAWNNWLFSILLPLYLFRTPSRREKRASGAVHCRVRVPGTRGSEDVVAVIHQYL